MSFLEDFSLGQYFPSSSVIHELDPRTKLLLIFSLVLPAGLTLNIRVYLLLLVFLALIYVLAKLPVFLLLGNLRVFLWLFLFIFGIHLLYNAGTKSFPNFTSQGLADGVLFSLRLVIFVFGALVLSFTTPAVELTNGFFKFLSPLKKLRVPIEETSLMMMIALRFTPLLVEEAFNLKKAQEARGADFEGNVWKRSRKLVPLLLPLFISCFRKADDLALALDARGYRSGTKRSSFGTKGFKRVDFVFWLLVLVILVLCLEINRL